MASKKDYRIEEYIYEMLLDLYRLECSNVFRYPVDIVTSRCPDYYSVIKEPMDLSTLKANYKDGLYKKMNDVRAELEKIINNCRTFNRTPNHPILKTCDKFQQCYQKRWKELDDLRRNLGLPENPPLNVEVNNLDLIEQKKSKKKESTLLLEQNNNRSKREQLQQSKQPEIKFKITSSSVFQETPKYIDYEDKQSVRAEHQESQQQTNEQFKQIEQQYQIEEHQQQNPLQQHFPIQQPEILIQQPQPQQIFENTHEIKIKEPSQHEVKPTPGFKFHLPPPPKESSGTKIDLKLGNLTSQPQQSTQQPLQQQKSHQQEKQQQSDLKSLLSSLPPPPQKAEYTPLINLQKPIQQEQKVKLEEQLIKKSPPVQTPSQPLIQIPVQIPIVQTYTQPPPIQLSTQPSIQVSTQPSIQISTQQHIQTPVQASIQTTAPNKEFKFSLPPSFYQDSKEKQQKQKEVSQIKQDIIEVKKTQVEVKVESKMEHEKEKEKEKEKQSQKEKEQQLLQQSQQKEKDRNESSSQQKSQIQNILIEQQPIIKEHAQQPSKTDIPLNLNLSKLSIDQSIFLNEQTKQDHPSLLTPEKSSYKQVPKQRKAIADSDDDDSAGNYQYIPIKKKTESEKKQTLPLNLQQTPQKIDEKKLKIDDKIKDKVQQTQQFHQHHHHQHQHQHQPVQLSQEKGDQNPQTDNQFDKQKEKLIVPQNQQESKPTIAVIQKIDSRQVKKAYEDQRIRKIEKNQTFLNRAFQQIKKTFQIHYKNSQSKALEMIYHGLDNTPNRATIRMVADFIKNDSQRISFINQQQIYRYLSLCLRSLKKIGEDEENNLDQFIIILDQEIEQQRIQQRQSMLKQQTTQINDQQMLEEVFVYDQMCKKMKLRQLHKMKIEKNVNKQPCSIKITPFSINFPQQENSKTQIIDRIIEEEEQEQEEQEELEEQIKYKKPIIDNKFDYYICPLKECKFKVSLDAIRIDKIIQLGNKLGLMHIINVESMQFFLLNHESIHYQQNKSLLQNWMQKIKDKNEKSDYFNNLVSYNQINSTHFYIDEKNHSLYNIYNIDNYVEIVVTLKYETDEEVNEEKLYKLFTIDLGINNVVSKQTADNFINYKDLNQQFQIKLACYDENISKPIIQSQLYQRNNNFISSLHDFTMNNQAYFGYCLIDTWKTQSVRWINSRQIQILIPFTSIKDLELHINKQQLFKI